MRWGGQRPGHPESTGGSSPGAGWGFPSDPPRISPPGSGSGCTHSITGGSGGRCHRRGTWGRGWRKGLEGFGCRWGFSREVKLRASPYLSDRFGPQGRVLGAPLQTPGRWPCSVVPGKMWGCPLASLFCQGSCCPLTAAPQVVFGCVPPCSCPPGKPLAEHGQQSGEQWGWPRGRASAHEGSEETPSASGTWAGTVPLPPLPQHPKTPGDGGGAGGGQPVPRLSISPACPWTKVILTLSEGKGG